jgi:hypothetical protein
MQNFDIPIPGENFLSDTRNQSWHRPPEYDHPDQFLKHVDKTFKKPQAQTGLDTLVSSGVSVTTMTDFFISRSIMDGLISIDFGILMAGPTARAIELMCVQLGIDYEMGFEDNTEVPTKEDVQHIADLIERDGLVEVDPEQEDVPEEEQAAEEEMGLMAPEADLAGEPADEDMQAEMLGLNAEEGPLDELQ